MASAASVIVLVLLIRISVHAKDTKGELSCLDNVGHPGQPTNITCQFLERQTLICKFDKTKGIEYFCSVDGHTGYRYVNACCENENSRSSASKNECRFECEDETVCTNNDKHMLKIVWTFEGSNFSYCQIANTSDLVKPGPVVDVKVKRRNETSITITWMKPKDNENVGYRYTYFLDCGSDDIKLKTITKKRKRISGTCSPLRPGMEYNISVRARPATKRGFTSDVVVKTVSTLEHIPTSGAVIDPGMFSVVGPSQAVFYPREIPVSERGGHITNHSVEIDGCSGVTKSPDIHWILVNLSSCAANTNFTIKTKAATKKGMSDASVATFDLQIFGMKHITDVKKIGDTLQWNLTKKIADPKDFTVHRCYGHQDKHQPQLVKCKTYIKSEVVGSTQRYKLPQLDPVKVACRSCAWLFAVSGRVGNDVTEMVWEAPNITESAETKAQTDNTKIIIIVVILVLLALTSLAILVLICLKKKENVMCQKFEVIMPEIDDYIFAPAIIDEEEKRRQQRDSGNGSMDQETEETEKSALITSNLSREEPKPHLQIALLDTKPEPRVVEQDHNNDLLRLISDPPQKEIKPTQASLTEQLPEPKPIGTKGAWDCSTESIVSIYRQVPNLEGSRSQIGLERSQVRLPSQSSIRSPSLSNARPFRPLQDAEPDPPQGSFDDVIRSKSGNKRQQICKSEFWMSGSPPQNSQPGFNAFPRCTSLPVGLSVLGSGTNRTAPEDDVIPSASEDNISKSAASYSTVDIS